MLLSLKKDDASKTQNTGKKNTGQAQTALSSLVEYLSTQGTPEAEVIKAVTGDTNGSN